MSEPIPESIPTSADRRSNRPIKKARSNTPLSQQSQHLEALFKNPDREINIDGPKAKSATAPPEIVANVQGSSAGAGSGEFHVYKASRRREYERLRAMDEEAAKEKADADYEEKQKKLREEEEAKLSKNRAKREKAKARQQKKKLGGEGSATPEPGNGGENGVLKRKLGPKKVEGASNIADDGAAEKNGTVEEGSEEQAPAEEGGGITFVDDD